MNKSGSQLFYILIVKSIADTLLVGVLAVTFFFTAFPPHFHGWGEATPDAIAGWVVDDALPWERVKVQLFVDGKFVANTVANLSRPDVLAAGWSKDEWHGYAFVPPALGLGIHEARVYALHASERGTHQTLQMVGEPIRFAVDENGKLTDLAKSKR